MGAMIPWCHKAPGFSNYFNDILLYSSVAHSHMKFCHLNLLPSTHPLRPTADVITFLLQAFVYSSKHFNKLIRQNLVLGSQRQESWPKSRTFVQSTVNPLLSSASTGVHCNVNSCWWKEARDMPGRYISPYDLNERMKRLDRSGLPMMPCTCDPECICADLCAGDLTQYRLCEENGLFCWVTEGWDIDDLDVPDLEGLKQSNSVKTSNSDEVQPMLALDTENNRTECDNLPKHMIYQIDRQIVENTRTSKTSPHTTH